MYFILCLCALLYEHRYMVVYRDLCSTAGMAHVLAGLAQMPETPLLPASTPWLCGGWSSVGALETSNLLGRGGRGGPHHHASLYLRQEVFANNIHKFREYVHRYMHTYTYIHRYTYRYILNLILG